MRSQLKPYLKKAWKFIWEDDSIASWLANIVLAFVLIKFVVYPTLGFLLQTDFPIVAVVSGSMEHGIAEDQFGNLKLCDKTFEERTTKDIFWETCGPWYEENTVISQEDFKDFPFSNGFNKGDIMILYGKDTRKINIGDVIVFRSGRPDPIIHRVVDKRENTFTTKGDHNARVIHEHPIKEDEIGEDQILGNAAIRIPLLGYIKIWFVELIQLVIR